MSAMSPELLESIEQQLEQTNRLVHSLYDSGDLSVDQYDAIVHGLSGASLLRKELARLREQAANAETARKAWTERGAKAEADARALRNALIAWIDADETSAFTDADNDLAELARALRTDTAHSGAALLAELEAARAVVAALRSARSTLQDAWPETRDLRRAMSAYDAAIKGEM